jgi:hypothetical protein
MGELKNYRIAWVYDQEYKGNGNPITLKLADAWIEYFKDPKNNPWNIYHYIELIE